MDTSCDIVKSIKEMNRLRRVAFLDRFLKGNAAIEGITLDDIDIESKGFVEAEFKRLQRTCVKVDDRWYSVRYFHHYGDKNGLEKIDYINEAIKDALELGQIKPYRRAGALCNIDDKVTEFTTCIIEADGRVEVARGYSFCSPNDVFCKAKGRKIALGRAIGQLKKALNVDGYIQTKEMPQKMARLLKAPSKSQALSWSDLTENSSSQEK